MTTLSKYNFELVMALKKDVVQNHYLYYLVRHASLFT